MRRVTRASSADAAGPESPAVPVRVARVDAEHLDHRDDLAVRDGGVVQLFGVERLVAGAHGVVQHGERLRHAEVVVHRRRERVGDHRAAHARVPGAGEPALDPLEEGADAVDGGLGLGERARRVVERRAVVRRPRAGSARRAARRGRTARRRRPSCRATSTSSARRRSRARCAPSSARSRRRPRSIWASSFSWCGNRRSSPPPWMSNSAPR